MTYQTGHKHPRLWSWYCVLLSGLALLWRRLMFRTTFIAITGSVGKTTATECLAGVLSSRCPVNATRHGSNGRYGIATTVLRTRFRHRFAVVEVGTKLPGALRKAAWEVNPDAVVMLSVGRTHTDNFPTLEHTAAEKAQLLSRLGRRGLAILNGDDPRVSAMAARCRGRALTFGHSSRFDLWAGEVSARWPARLSFRVHWRGESEWVSTRLVGEHWVPSVLGALAAAVSCGMDLKSAAAALEYVEPHRARLKPVVLPSGAIMLRDDFNPTVQSLPAALRVLEQAQARRRLLALSDVSDTGQEVDQRYRELGQAMARSTDWAIFFGEHCRRGAEAALAAGMRPESVHAFPGWQEAARFLNSELREGDLVLLRCFETDHPERIFFAQFGTVECTKPKCLIVHLCDYCRELRPGLERAAEAPAPAEPFWMPRALHL